MTGVNFPERRFAVECRRVQHDALSRRHGIRNWNRGQQRACIRVRGSGEEIMLVFKRLHESGNTIVLVTHEADIAAHAHRVIYVRDGQVEKDVTRAA